MATYPFPNWIQPPDLAGDYARGQQLGMEQQRMAMQAEENQRAHLMEQQRLEVDRAYKEQQLALDKQQLDQAQKLNALKIQDAAQQLDAQKKYQAFIDAGGDPTQGLLRYAVPMGASIPAGLFQALNLSRYGQPPESPIAKLQFDRRQALARGDKESVAQIDAAIQENLTSKGFSGSLVQDDQGHISFQFGQGPQKPTVGVTTQAQEKLLQYKNVTDLIDWLSKNLKPEHVGVRGLVGEVAGDKLLAQIAPQFANQDRIQSRALMRYLNESMLRKISDDTTGRYSAADKEEARQAMIDLGGAESGPDVKQKLAVARQRFSKLARTYSTGIGQKPPLWSLSDDELKAAYTSKQISFNELESEAKRRYGER